MLAFAEDNFFTERNTIQKSQFVSVVRTEESNVVPIIHEAFKLNNRLKLLVFYFFCKDELCRIGKADFSQRVDFSQENMPAKLRGSINRSITNLPEEEHELENKRFRVVEVNERDNNEIAAMTDDMKAMRNKAKYLGARCFIAGDIKIVNIPFSSDDIRSLTNTDKENEEDFIEYLKDKIGEDKTDYYKNVILEYAAFDCSLNLDSLKNVSESIKGKLDTKKSEIFQNKDAIRDAIRGILTENEYRENIKEILRNIKCKYRLTTYHLNALRDVSISGIEIKAPIYDTEGQMKIEESDELNLKIINAYNEEKDIDALAKTLADKYLIEFPFEYDDEINNVLSDKTIVTDLSNSKIKINSKLIIYDNSNIRGEAIVKEKRLTAQLISPPVIENYSEYGVVTE